MDRAKLTDNLASRLEQAGADDVLEIVLELHAPSELDAAEQPRSRAEKIDLKKGAFNRVAGPVEELITTVGGEVTGVAWINQTLRARVPADRVGRLTELDAVATLDTPRLLQADHG